MASIPEYKNIYRYALSALENASLSRRELISKIIDSFSLSAEEASDYSVNGRQNTLKSLAGIVVNDMEAKGVIVFEGDLYKKLEDKLIAIRIDECEHAILNLIKESPKTKPEIKDALVNFFGTDSTPTVKDDNRLFTYIGQILKKLLNEDVIEWDGAVYSASKEKSALISEKSEVMTLKSTFLRRIHSKGGEFFENYFVNLISRYFIRTGKTVTKSYVTGGSDDGGIDGIVHTVDSLGFKETIMLQMKNRSATITETDTRGFYGAVCARQGSRGIFATISDFHPMAQKFLDSIDNCVGVNGSKIFAMAYDTSYGIKRVGDKLTIDYDLI